MRNGIPERLDRLARQRSPRLVRDRDRCHDRESARSCSSKIPFDREQTGLQVQRVEGGFREQQIDAPFDQRRHLLVIRLDVLVKRHRPVARDPPPCGEIDAVLAVGPIEPATKRGRSGVRAVNSSAALRAQAAAARLISRIISGWQIEFFHPNRAGPKRVGFDNVRPGLQILDGESPSPSVARSGRECRRSSSIPCGDRPAGLPASGLRSSPWRKRSFPWPRPAPGFVGLVISRAAGGRWILVELQAYEGSCCAKVFVCRGLRIL